MTQASTSGSSAARAAPAEGRAVAARRWRRRDAGARRPGGLAAASAAAAMLLLLSAHAVAPQPVEAAPSAVFGAAAEMRYRYPYMAARDSMDSALGHELYNATAVASAVSAAGTSSPTAPPNVVPTNPATLTDETTTWSTQLLSSVAGGGGGGGGDGAASYQAVVAAPTAATTTSMITKTASAAPDVAASQTTMQQAGASAVAQPSAVAAQPTRGVDLQSWQASQQQALAEQQQQLAQMVEEQRQRQEMRDAQSQQRQPDAVAGAGANGVTTAPAPTAFPSQQSAFQPIVSRASFGYPAESAAEEAGASRRDVADHLARRQATSPPAVTATSAVQVPTLSSFVGTATAATATASAPAPTTSGSRPDIGWVDTIVGGVPYKSGDLAASVVWILATSLFVPLLLIRLLRRSSLISMVLFGIFLFGIVFTSAMGLRAWLSDNTPTTKLLLIQNVLLSVLPPLLLEPMLALLGLYAKQGQANSGVPVAAGILRVLNLVALLLYALQSGYTGQWLVNWDKTLMDQAAGAAFAPYPGTDPPAVVRIAPIVAAFLMLITIAGGLLLIPVARGDSGSMRPGAFLAVLLLLLATSNIYRVVQSLHASAVLTGWLSENPFGLLGQLTLRGVAPGSMTATPIGMYRVGTSGIDWQQLQDAQAGRKLPQTPVVFHIVYILPMWLLTFLFFFVHAPGDQKKGGGGGDKKKGDE